MQLDGFLKLESFVGPSSDGLHTEEFEILSFHHRLHRSDTLTGAGSALRPATASHGELSIVKLFTTKTAKLLQSLCQGKKYTKATVSVRGYEQDENGAKDAYQVLAENVVISRLHYVTQPALAGFGSAGDRIVSGSALHQGPLAHLELLYFGKIQWKYGTTEKFATPGS